MDTGSLAGAIYYSRNVEQVNENFDHVLKRPDNDGTKIDTNPVQEVCGCGIINEYLEGRASIRRGERNEQIQM